MADGRHLGKIKNGYILAMVCRITTKFGMVTQFDPLEHSDRRNVENLII